jgi:hypothetical protein
MVFGIWEHAGKWGGGYVVDLIWSYDRRQGRVRKMRKENRRKMSEGRRLKNKI